MVHKFDLKDVWLYNEYYLSCNRMRMKGREYMKKGILAVLTMAAGTLTGALSAGFYQAGIVKKKQNKVDKFKAYYNMLNQWLIVKQEGKSLEKYFLANSYNTIAIYGMGEMGNRLLDELENSSVKVAYAIDKDAETTYSEIEVLEISDELPEVDAIVVSAIFAFDEIEETLNEKVSCDIISLEDVIYEV